MKHRLVPILSAGLFAICSAAFAQGTGVALGGFQNRDPNAPLEVTSDRLDLTQAEGTATFSGNVLATQGDMKLSAETVLVQYVVLPDGTLGNTVETITATGNVLLVTPSEAAESDKAVYAPLKNEVTMTGNVLLTQGPNTLAGERLVVDLLTGTGQVEGRVRTILQTGDTAQ